MPGALASSASLWGRVSRAGDGAALAGAAVAITTGRLAVSGREPPAVATTDADGRWDLSPVAPGAYVLAVTAAGHAPAVRELTLASGEHRADVSLQAGGTEVTGTITTERRDAIVNARVSAYGDADAPCFVAFTGADGHYQLSLEAGSYQLEVTHDEYRRAWRNITAGDSAAPGDFTLVRGGVIRGQVIARDTGRSVPEATVVAFGGTDLATARAGGDGRFTLRALHDGQITIDARGRGYASVAPTAVELGAGSHVAGIRVITERACSIAGRVVAANDPGSGVVGAMVNAIGIGDVPWFATEVSDLGGNFELVGVRPRPYVLSASKRGMLLGAGVEIEVGDTDISGVTLAMGRGATLSGRVEPRAVAQIGLARRGQVSLPAGDQDAANVAMARTRSEANGEFTLRGVPSGDFEVSAMATDGRSGMVAVSVTDADQEGLIIGLSARAAVAGRVIDPDGAPAAGFHVFAHRLDVPLTARLHRDGIHRGATTAADGSFKVVGLAAGCWRLAAIAPDGRPETGRVEVDLSKGAVRTGVDITVEARDAPGSDDEVTRPEVQVAEVTPALEATASVAGVAVAALTEAPVAGLSVMAAGACAETDANGRFVLEPVPAGAGEIVLSPKDQLGIPDRYRYSARAGERVDLGRIEVVPPRTGEPGTYGLVLEIRGDTLVVSRSRPGGPAERAGIEVGDSIASIDGRCVDALGPERARRLLSESVGVGELAVLQLGRGTCVTITAIEL